MLVQLAVERAQLRRALDAPRRRLLNVDVCLGVVVGIFILFDVLSDVRQPDGRAEKPSDAL